MDQTDSDCLYQFCVKSELPERITPGQPEQKKFRIRKLKKFEEGSIQSLLEKFEILSINQLNAQIKLMEIWKSIKIEDYPLQIKTQLPSETGVTTRADANKRPCEIGVSLLTQNLCISLFIWTRTWQIIYNYRISDAIRIWI